MEWEQGKLTKAVIHSKLGGYCRVRTNEKLNLPNMKAQIPTRVNSNPLFSFVEAGQPMIKNKTKSNVIPANQGFVLDFETEKKKVYVLK